MKIIMVFMALIICTFSNAEPLPKPWYQANLEQYEAGVLWTDDSQKNRIGYLKSKTKTASSGSVLQNISPPEEWLGRRVRLTALIKTSTLYGSASIFMSVDHGDGYKTFDQTPKNRLGGDGDWQKFSIVLDIPSARNAEILFGVSLRGEGEVNFDNFKFEEVGYDVEVTGKAEERGKKRKPANLNFESDEKSSIEP